ncbi:MAG: DNA polymerase III subunit gamma/tau C-terminal domain-containing protein, partial [Gammaproteobacteria bacterium]
IQQLPGVIDHDFDGDMIVALSSQLTQEDVQLYYQIALVGQRDLDLATDPRSGFEMVMLRMLTFRPARIEAMPAKPAQIRQTTNKEERTVDKPAVIEQTSQIAEQSSPETVSPKHDQNWADMIAAMKINGPTRELANNCVLETIDDKVCTLLVDPGYIRGARAEETLRKALQAYRGSPLKLVINTKKTAIDTPAVQLAKEREDKQQAAVDAINSDENIQALKDHFDARVLPGTIEPV